MLQFQSQGDVSRKLMIELDKHIGNNQVFF